MPKQRTNTLRLLTIVVLLVFLASGRSPLFCEGPQAVYGATTGAAAPVQLMRQMPELPNGCEVTSLAMMLGPAGYPIDNVTLYQRYLPKQALLETADMRYSGSPEAVYVGNAADVDDGWYCFEQPIIAAGDAWLAEADSALRMVRLSGLDEKQLLRYAKAGRPLIVWVTLGYQDPVRDVDYAWTLDDGTRYVPYMNLHCVVITGEENGFYIVADPISGWRYVQKEALWQSFDAMGRRAVAVAKV